MILGDDFRFQDWPGACGNSEDGRFMLDNAPENLSLKMIKFDFAVERVNNLNNLGSSRGSTAWREWMRFCFGFIRVSRPSLLLPAYINICMAEGI